VNLFLLPSWYPSAANPVSGAFVRDQVAALASSLPGLRIVVGSWGHHDGALSLRDPAMSMRALGWRLRARSAWRECGGSDGRWHEALTPRLSWTLAWARGGIGGQLRASRRNLDRAIDHLGRIDLIHAHVGFPAGWIASVLCAERGIPYVLTEHMGPFPVPQLMDGGRPCAELRSAYAGARAVVAVSDALADAIHAHGLACGDVIPNVVRTERFAAAATRRPAERPFVILTLASLTRGKGMDLLLDALAKWNPTRSEVRLDIGGDGPERRSLERQVDRLGLRDRVRFLGWLAPDEVPQALARCHAFALASRHETFGVVLAEALAAGRPVLSTRCGGPQSVLGEGDGLLVEPDDVDALARGLCELRDFAHTAQPARLRARAEARFGPQAVASRLVALYRKVLEP
jgi:glycosyltransferase involved in cell wall biosynthesis